MQPFETPGYKTDLFAGFDAMLGIPAPAKENSPKIKPHVPREPRYVVDVKSGTAFKSISEAADMLDLPQHVLRFWESKFPQIKPIKLKGGRRYYRPDDIESLSLIKQLLYKQGYTIKGARKAFADARRRKEPHEETMSETPPAARKSRRKTTGVEDTPLFAAPKAAAPSAPPKTPLIPEAKRQQLSDIRDELLGLREMLASLPPLKAEVFES